MHAQQQSQRLETMLASEATLAPFPPGEYTIVVGGMEHPTVNLANSTFPSIRVDVLPGSAGTCRLASPDGHSAWLSRTGESVALTVAQPGGLLLFTTYRPSEYATTGIRMDIKRHNPAQPQATMPQQPPMQPQQPPMQPQQPPVQPFGVGGLSYSPHGGQPAFGGYPGRPQAMPAFGGPQGFAQPQPGFAQPAPAFGQPAPSFGQPAAGFGQPAAAAPQPPRTFTPPSAPAGPMPVVRMAGHLEGEGDVAFDPGQGAGRPGSKRRLEAVALYVEGVALQDLQYAAIGPNGQPMPWVSPPQFTGSRGTGAPMLGFAAKLGGEAAGRYTIAYAGTFLGAGPVPAARNGEFLRSPVPGDALESLAVILEPKV
ncbi:hypothetical protein [Solidesulfovibrio magneticus]|uniref:Uncharacterized protein n=1 Tax=Solidesulfovibrio magneticus (strain ATCC 700980 / DSM 13731 / RS-1) TaxID=573370 RepID=C4XMP7_SOLM1|nr:hypothetical protein [Solidesulfovibrio magneticus]BAH74838.1 hypothetical protein DMR_13470 [Solidesulfovibrio magneticus RS-1]